MLEGVVSGGVFRHAGVVAGNEVVVATEAFVFYPRWPNYEYVLRREVVPEHLSHVLEVPLHVFTVLVMCLHYFWVVLYVTTEIDQKLLGCNAHRCRVEQGVVHATLKSKDTS